MDPRTPSGSYPPTRHYDHAPITEAVIELRCELPEKDIKKLSAEIGASVAEAYRETEELREWRGEFSKEGISGEPSKVFGCKFVSLDNHFVFQVRRDGFAFSQLAPYDKWESFRNVARGAWDVYKSGANPSRIHRVSVRFINRVDIPAAEGELVDLDDYFNTAPRIAVELPQSMTNYFMRLQIPLHEPGVLAIVTETGVQPPSEGLLSTVLDIDVIVEADSFDESAAWETIDGLRRHKNGIFESCITDKVRALIS